MTFTSDKKKEEITPEELKKRLAHRELSEEKRMIGDIITEAMNLETDMETVITREEVSRDERSLSVWKKKRLPKKIVEFVLAAMVLALIVAISPLPSICQEIIANNGKDKYQTEENRYDVSGDGVGTSGESIGIVTHSIDSWTNIGQLKSFLPELLIPEYIPAGYEFQDATITKWEEDGANLYKVSYCFKDKINNSLNITQSQMADDFAIKRFKTQETAKEIDGIDGKIIYTFYKNENDLSIGVGIKNIDRISVESHLEEDDVIKIFINLSHV